MSFRDTVEAAIDEIRPALHMDGGDCEIVDVDEAGGMVSLRLVGACGGCPMSTLTLKQGIERIVKERVPAVRQVETVVAF
ncbi:MAG TPA: NifU family protein [Candidatus Thermoplasmatota archaeon]|nr:NifU family protein [Candidatus Thermoplasmatota archaeon]